MSKTVACLCGKEYEVTVELVGKVIRCLVCGRPIRMAAPRDAAIRSAAQSIPSDFDPWVLVKWGAALLVVLVGGVFVYVVFLGGKAMDATAEKGKELAKNADFMTVDRGPSGAVQKAAFDGDPREYLASVRFDEIEMPVKNGLPNGGVHDGKFWKLVIVGTPAGVREAVARTYGDPRSAEDLRGVLELRHRLYVAQRGMARYVRGYAGRFGVGTGVTDLHTYDTCSAYIGEYDRIIADLETRAAARLRDGADASVVAAALQPPVTGFTHRAVELLRGRFPAEVREGLSRMAVGAAEAGDFVSAAELAGTCDRAELGRALLSKIDRVEDPRLVAALEAVPARERIVAMLRCAGWSSCMRELHEKHGAALPARERLAMAGDVPGQKRELLASFKDEPTVELLADLAAYVAGGGDANLARAFARRCEGLSAAAYAEAFRGKDGGALAGLIVDDDAAAPVREGAVLAMDASDALRAAVRDRVLPAWRGERAIVRAKAVAADTSDESRAVLLAWLRRRGEDTDAVVAEIVRSRPGEVMRYLDLVTLRTRDEEVRRALVRAMAETFTSGDPRPEGASTRDAHLVAHGRAADALPVLVDAYCENRAIRGSKEMRAYVLDLIRRIGDDRLVAFLVEEWKRASDRRPLDGTLRSVTKAVANKGDWAAWLKSNGSKLPKQLRIPPP